MGHARLQRPPDLRFHQHRIEPRAQPEQRYPAAWHAAAEFEPLGDRQRRGGLHGSQRPRTRLSIRVTFRRARILVFASAFGRLHVWRRKGHSGGQRLGQPERRQPGLPGFWKRALQPGFPRLAPAVPAIRGLESVRALSGRALPARCGLPACGKAGFLRAQLHHHVPVFQATRQLFGSVRKPGFL